MSEERPSKSQRKRDMHELQALGAELVALPEDRLAAVDLPERLVDAVQQARHIRDFEGRRRQLQYIGKLMRTVDAEPIRAQLESWKSGSRAETARFKRIEHWRERLITDRDALEALFAEFPSADAARIRELVDGVHRERAAARPPKNFRALFKALDALIP